MNNDYNRDYENPYYENETNQNSYNYGTGGYNAMAGMGAATESLSSYIAKTFMWMALGLLVTFGVSMGLALSGFMNRLMMSGALSIVLIVCTVAQLAVVAVMGIRVRQLSVGSARGMFLAYAAPTGVTFSLYFYMFDLRILVFAFAATAILFAGMAIAARVFNMQLDTIRPYLFAGLIALLIFGIVRIFLRIDILDLAFCYLGVAIFLGYTAYDTTKIRDNYYYYTNSGDGTMLAKASIFSALQLYLDFVNLFLYILRILSRNSGSSRK
jgi:FtsH-binding integral membrane protein